LAFETRQDECALSCIESQSVTFRSTHGVVSLLDMHEVSLFHFQAVMNFICVMQHRCQTKNPPGNPLGAAMLGQVPRFNEQETDDLRIEFQLIATRLEFLGLPTSAKVVDNYVHDLTPLQDQSGAIVHRKTQAASEVLARTHEILRAIKAESEIILFLRIPREDVEWYRAPFTDWEAVLKRWLEMKSNVEECSKCFALERYCAAVFHALLVAEFGVIKVSELFGVQGDKPGWGAVERLHKITLKPYKDRSAVEVTHFDLLSKLVPLMHSIKTSWRHKLDHVDNQLVWLDADFSPKVAKEIISATQGFMRILAMELPESSATSSSVSV
jgi:hypothetical protein